MQNEDKESFIRRIEIANDRRNGRDEPETITEPLEGSSFCSPNGVPSHNTQLSLSPSIAQSLFLGPRSVGEKKIIRSKERKGSEGCFAVCFRIPSATHQCRHACTAALSPLCLSPPPAFLPLLQLLHHSRPIPTLPPQRRRLRPTTKPC
jgi:hypothetical protein